MKVYLRALTNTSPVAGRRRFSAYTMERGTLKAIWPRHSERGRQELPVAKEELPDGMIYSVSAYFPAYHFCLQGWGYSKPQEIGIALARFYGETVDIYTFDDGDPSHRCTVEPRDDERRAAGVPRIIERIEIFGLRWFGRTHGNTYFSAVITVNDEHVCTIREDGYGDYYKQRAWDWLARNGYVDPEKYNHGGLEQPHVYCTRKEIYFRSSAHNVTAKKHLAKSTSNQLNGYGR